MFDKPLIFILEMFTYVYLFAGAQCKSSSFFLIDPPDAYSQYLIAYAPRLRYSDTELTGIWWNAEKWIKKILKPVSISTCGSITVEQMRFQRKPPCGTSLSPFE